jgi:L-iditol 2-dehydrogenase
VRALRKLAPGPGAVELQDVPRPEAGPGQALVAVDAVGICGTDLHILAGEYATVPPVTIGHEVAGRVAAVGSPADEAWLGAEVVVETFFSTCGACPDCRAGRPALCRSRRSIGTHVDGGFAEAVVVPVRNLRARPAGVGPAGASMTEPLACVVHSLGDPGRVEAGDRVLVTGPGAIGLLAAQVARAAGADVTVAGLSTDGRRLELARELGFAVAVDDVPEEVDVAIECSGSGGGVTACLRALRRAGRMVVIGLAGKPVTIPFDEVCLKQLEVTGWLASTPRSWDRAVRLIESRRVLVEPLVTHVIPLDEWEEGFATARSGGGAKVVLTPAA